MVEERSPTAGGHQTTLFLCGDVMLGRGVDQILPYPGDPTLREGHVRDARAYVDLAEARGGPIPRPVDEAWPWGDALRILDRAAPDVRVLNLETSITRSDDFAPGKGVHYRMSPGNVGCLTAVRPDVCALANNHVLDFGASGLTETLDTLAGTGLRAAGAGRDATEAGRPAAVTIGEHRRVLVFSFGLPSSGVPASWAAAGERPGVDFVPDLSPTRVTELTQRVRRVRRPGDIVVASVHWGANWGYEVSGDQVRFAHGLVDGGVDIVHGHSSHHPRPVEVYHGRLILYGCGDLIDDYEGISGYEEYRDDLRLLYLASVEADTGELVTLRMVPMQVHRMRLRTASIDDSEWLRARLNRISGDFGLRVDRQADGALTVRC
jgi:poly-gamma-glutamate capsule biosynthesis protein CapA/YwtB (metallophosphatase superfamily)